MSSRSAVVVLTFLDVHQGHVARAGQHARLVLAERLPAQFQRACQMALGFRIQAEIFVGLADRQPNRGFDQRLRLELALDTRRGAVERGAHLEVGIGFRVRTGLRAGAGLSQQIVLQEIVHRFRGLGFAVRAVAFPRDPSRLDSRRRRKRDEQRHERGGHRRRRRGGGARTCWRDRPRSAGWRRTGRLFRWR